MAGFTVSGGKILDPDGNPWIARGLNIYAADAAAQMLALFPDTTFVRLPTGTYVDPTYWDGFIAAMTARKIVCEVEYHPWPLLPTQTGAALAAEVAWYGRMAAHYASNPYVWLASMNEPQSAGMSTEHAAVYNAIRAAGNNNPVIFMGGVGGGNPGQTGLAVLNASAYLNARNVIFSLHSYGWSSGFSTNQAAVNAKLAGNALDTGIQSLAGIHSADGPIPVIIDEFGPSTSGSSLDANAAQVIQAVTVWAIQQGLSAGYAGWNWAADAFNELQANGTLTNWGKQLAAAMAATKGTTVATPPALTPGTWLTPTVNGMQYMVLLPANYDQTKKYPTILYLHQLDMGSGGPGLLQPEINPWFNTAPFRTTSPCIVVAPLLDQNADKSMNTFNFGGMTVADNVGETNALAALKQVLGQYSTDPNRVYVTGNSMGGIGTWDMLVKWNAYTGTSGKLFAAGMPLAGADYAQGLNPSAAIVQALSKVPIWAIHGAQDTTVALQWDRLIFAAIKAAGGIMKYTEDANLGHDVWDTYYPQTAVWDWLFAQKVTGTVATAPAAPASPDNTVIMAGSAAAITDAGGAVWVITPGGQIAINGMVDASTNGVKQLAYVKGTVWQENSASLWWGKTSPAAPWLPVAGTATSPVPTVVVPPSGPTHLTVGAKLDAALALLTAAKADLGSLTP